MILTGTRLSPGPEVIECLSMKKGFITSGPGAWHISSPLYWFTVNF